MVTHMRTRTEKSHKLGRKSTPVGEQIVGRTAMQLLRRVLRVTEGGTMHWQESNPAVAKSLHVDPSTVKRTVRKFCEVGLLRPIETKGGRGHASVYVLDERIARDVLASGRWPTNLPSQRREAAQEEGTKAAHPKEPAQQTPPLHVNASSDQTPPCGARQDAAPNSDAALGGRHLLGDLDPSALVSFSTRYGIPVAPLCRGIRDWWEVQPETARRGRSERQPSGPHWSQSRGYWAVGGQQVWRRS